MATNLGGTKPVQNNEFVTEILKDITAINLTEQESTKLRNMLRYETGTAHLFTYINTIYKIIGGNFKNPEKFLIIPFVNERGIPHINIHKI